MFETDIQESTEKIMPKKWKHRRQTSSQRKVFTGRWSYENKTLQQLYQLLYEQNVQERSTPPLLNVAVNDGCPYRITADRRQDLIKSGRDYYKKQLEAKQEKNFNLYKLMKEMSAATNMMERQT